MKIKVGEVILDFLIQKKVKYVFLITGGAIGFLIDSFSRKRKIKYICALHEQSAAMMADSYSRLGPNFAATMSTSGPGATNLITGMYCSWFDSIPNIHLTGQVNQNESREGSKFTKNCRQIGFQETDIVALSKNFTKKSVKIKNHNKIYEILEDLDFHAHDKRPGPVLLDIPMNVQKEHVNKKKIISRRKNKTNYKSFANLIFKYLKNSKRPCILLGAGVRNSGLSENDVIKLSKIIKVPYLLTWSGFDLMDHNHPLNFNTIGVYGHRSSNFIVQNCDLLITVGCRLDTRTTGSRVNTFAREAKVISVDLDKNELNKNRGLKIHHKIVQDAAVFINNLLRSNDEFKANTEWLTYCNMLRKKFPFVEESRFKGANTEIYNFMNVLSEVLDKKSVIIPDDGGHLTWTMQGFKIKKGQRLFSAFGNSPMGYALPASIGAAFARPSSNIICIDGDGSIQINLQDLHLLDKFKLNVKIILINNDGYGIIRQFQSLYLGKRYEASKKGITNPDFKKVSNAFNLPYYKISTNKNLKSRLNKLISKTGPVFIEVLIDPNQTISPKLEFGRPIEDVSPLINRSIFDKLMISNRKIKKANKNFQESN